MTAHPGVAFVPGQVPGLTLPGSSEAREAMMRMEGSSTKMQDDSVRGKRDSMKMPAAP